MKLGRKSLSVVGVLCASALALSACSPGGGPTPASPQGSAPTTSAPSTDEKIPPKQLTTALLFSPEHWQDEAVASYAEEVGRLTDGAIGFDFYYGDALLKAADISGGLRDGVADIGVTIFAYNPAEFPIGQWSSLLAHLQDPRPVAGVLQAVGTTLEWSLLNQEVLAEMDGQGLYPLTGRIMIAHTYALLCKNDVTSMADAKGLRVRAGGQPWAGELESLGMVPTVLATAETYEGLQRGVIDCSLNPPGDLKDLGLWDVATNVIEGPFSGASGFGLNMGKDAWEELSPAAQDAMREALPAYFEALYGGWVEEQYAFWVGSAERGMTVHTMSDDMLGAIKSHQDQVVATLVEQAPAGLADPQALLDDYQRLNDKWLGIVEKLGYADQDNWADWVAARPNGPDVDLGPWVQALEDEIFSKQAR